MIEMELHCTLKLNVKSENRRRSLISAYIKGLPWLSRFTCTWRWM